MKKYILFTGLFCIALFAHAQNSLQGKITDQNNNSLIEGATIYIPDLKVGTSSAADGTYLLHHLPAGKFLVEIKALGYNALLRTITIQGNTEADFSLLPSVTEINDVVITGVSKATERKLNPVPSIVVNRQHLLEHSATNIIDALSRQPGISQINTGPAISKPVIRGLGYNRVVTLNNGLRQEGQQWGDEHGIEIDEYSVDRIEIIKGPGSLLYGSDAMAGVINLLAPKPVDKGKIIGEALANYQTNNGLTGWSAMNAGNLNGIHWLARISQKRAADYRNAYDGRVYNSGFNELNANTMAGINHQWGYVHLSLSTFNQQIGMVEGERDSLGRFTREVPHDSILETETVPESELNTYKLSVPKQQVNHYRVALQQLYMLGRSRLGIDLSWQENQRREFGDPFAPNQYELYFLLHTFSYHINYFLPEIKGWESTVGISGMQQRNQNKGMEFIIPGYSLFDYGLFAVTRKNFKQLHVSGGLRYDQRLLQSQGLFLDSNEQSVPENTPGAETKFAAFERSFGNLTGSAGASYNFSQKLILKANASKGFRAPNMAELGSNGKHEGTLRYEYGNSNLKPESSMQFDLGINYTSEHLTFEASLFSNSIRNYIYTEKLSAAGGGDSIADPEEGDPAYQYRQGNATLSGGELKVDLHPHPLDWLHFENTFSFVQGIQSGKNDSSKYLPFMPPARILSELRGNWRKAGSYLSDVFAYVQFDYYFNQNQVLLENNTETATPSFNLLNAGIGTSVMGKKKNVWFNLYIAVNNLLDVSYQHHLNRLKYAAINPATGRTGVWNMGRNVSIKVTVPLTFK